MSPIAFYDASEGFSDATEGRIENPSSEVAVKDASTERGGYNHCSHGALSPCHPREEKSAVSDRGYKINASRSPAYF